MEQEQEAAAMEPEVDLSPEEMKEAEREVIQCKLACYVFVFLTSYFFRNTSGKYKYQNEQNMSQLAKTTT